MGKVLELKEGMRVEAIISIGYPKEDKQGQPESSLLYERVSYEKFGKTK